MLAKHQLKHRISWNLSGKPFLAGNGELVKAAVQAVENVTKLSLV
ncbi:succinyl-diaminopimelate desuccinylase [Actinobacillus equuli]|nr:succinyl-diaminopimelate desuccinylase [Actinobacillus equuli]